MMEIIEYVLLGLALAADASSVSLVYGARFVPFRWRYALVPALAFGIAQGIMPVIGWLGGELLEQFIKAIDHWVAFGILLVVGGKFIWDSFGETEIRTEDILKPLPIFLAAFATSIDACAVGFSLSLAGKNILLPAVIVALTTFLCSMICHRIGSKLGEKFGSKFMIFGGIVLIGIGIKILLEHLMA